MTDVFQGLAGIAMLAWYAAAIYVGARLLRMGMQRDNRPARLVGIYLLVAMGLGGATMVVPISRGSLGSADITSLDRVLLGGGCVLTATGIFAILTFTREVFRRESAWARWLATAIALMVVAGLVGHGLDTGFYWNLSTRWGVLFLVGTILANGWTSLEALAYHAMMRRRSKLGLGDPLVANRFLLWGVGAGASASLLVLSLAQEWVRVALGPQSLNAMRAVSLPLLSLLGLACAVCYLFAFAPAGWYARRIAAAPVEEH